MKNSHSLSEELNESNKNKHFLVAYVMHQT